MVKVLVKKLDPKVKLPEYKSNGASGMDILAFIKKPISIKPKTSYIIPTGLSAAFARDYEIQIRPRSGLAAKNNISVLNTPGTIDSDYRGEIKVVLINLSNTSFTINPGDRIAQMVFANTTQVEFEEVNDLEKTTRGDSGFGSTGKL